MKSDELMIVVVAGSFLTVSTCIDAAAVSAAIPVGFVTQQFLMCF